MRSARHAVSTGFLIFGVSAGSLLPRIPALKEGLHLSDGQIGNAFLAWALGAVLGAILARPLLKRGVRVPVRIAVVGVCVTLIAPAVAPSYFLFVNAFGIGGLCTGLLDVLLNSQAAEIEREAGRPMINGFHAFWSLGAIIGSAVAVGAAALSVSPLIHFTAVAVVLTASSIPLLAAVPDTKGGAAALLPSGTTRWRARGAVSVVAALAFLGILVEGGGGDWSAIYLRDFGRAPEDVAAVAFGVLSVAMTLVRFSADRITAVTGARAVAGLGGLVGGLGFALAIAVPTPAVAIAGFALVGAGAAVMVPLAFSAGANIDEAGNALTIVAAAGYAGSIVGPPLIGAAADAYGLRAALAIPMAAGLAVLVIMAATRVLSSKPTRRHIDAAERVERQA